MKKEFTIKLFATDKEIAALNNDELNLDAVSLGITIACQLQDALDAGCHTFFVNLEEAISI
jgi:hypothetical protein